MSLKNIQTLKQFGIFQNHTNANAKNFGKYNLFYGWNGSGKSTLSGLLKCIESKATSAKFPSSEFIVNIDDGTSITQKNIAENNLNVYTFNQEFIDENISWNNVVKSILIVDKAKIKELEKLKELKTAQKADSETYIKIKDEIKNLEEAISKFGTDSARRLKINLQSIDTSDNHYLNYNKTKFEAFVEANLHTMETGTSLLDEGVIINLINAAKPNQKNSISYTPKALDNENFNKAKIRLDNLLNTNVVSKTIQRLIEHSDIKSWVETGLEIHENHNTNICEFCGNEVSEERSKQLEEHFNNDYKTFQERLVSADGWIASQYIQPQLFPSASDLYEELAKDYIEACTALEKHTKFLNEEIATWHTTLKGKTANQLETGLKVDSIKESSIKAFNDASTVVSKIIEKHNYKSANFKEETDKAKKLLELHYATTEVNNFGYHDKKNEIAKLKPENEKLNTEIKNRSTEIRTLESSLSNEGLGAEKFNESLHKFLGRSELTLRFNSEKKGYEILRNDSEPVEGHLSEGEKTAIAFVYFITKLKENDNSIEDTIVVVDDPISSFDSNHLFHAYSYMKLNCDKAKQLFVLTHNFTFFKLVRDWISRKNNKDNQDIANFYVVMANSDSPRASTYLNAEPALTRYNSEYHYIFSRLYSLKNQQTLATDDHFLAANLARKLLEAFLSFKFPKNRGNFTNLFNTAASLSENLEEVRKDIILKFINEYSHNDLIETNDDFVENLMGESASVISDIFDWINELDEKHYQEMIEVVS